MKISNRWRRLGVAGGTALLLLVVVAVALPRLVATAAWRERALAATEAATGGRVALGEAQLTVLPHLALKLGAGRIEGTGSGLRAARGQDWGIASYEAEFDAVEVRIRLLPLLSRRLEAGEVRVAGPRLHLVRDGQRTLAEDYRLVLRDLDLGRADPDAAPPPGAPFGAGIPADLACRAELTVGTLAIGGAAYTEVTATAALAGRVLEVSRAAARLGGGGLGGSATLDWAGDPEGELTFAYTATGVAAGDLLGPWVPDLARRLEGKLDAAGHGSCGLRDAATALATLAVTGSAGAGEGVLHAADWLRDVAPYLGRRQDLKDIRFTHLEHAYRIERERYLVDALLLDGPDTAWRGTGSIGLDGSLDLALEVKLPPGFTPELGSWSFLAETLRDPQGRVQLDLLLGGRAARPTVGLDLSRLKAAAPDRGAAAVKEGVGRLLDKWKSK